MDDDPQVETEVNAYYNELIPQGTEDWLLLHQVRKFQQFCRRARSSRGRTDWTTRAARQRPSTGTGRELATTSIRA
ncbi:hypothetical protein PsorP6_018141 [Peronosclerospora sorghi]|uniref:Uncharacterized protein n=1 Tax=Peronosclerospora sorghi TaxID=230839 RepID=A0ACC0WC31_9STRA|nr:hypothetical protein PsorP6_018141 [Peronosclerospora sorghi]